MARREDEKDPSRVRVRDWFVGDTASQLPRRHEIWTLLGWYHRTVVEPQLGFEGALRRLWYQITGQTGKLSPWREFQDRVELVKARRQMEAAIAAASDVPSPAPTLHKA